MTTFVEIQVKMNSICIYGISIIAYNNYAISSSKYNLYLSVCAILLIVFFFNDTLEERVINFLNENLVRYLSFKFAHHVFEITVVVSSIHIYI